MRGALEEDARLYKLEELAPSCSCPGSAIAMSEMEATFVLRGPAYLSLVEKVCRSAVLNSI